MGADFNKTPIASRRHLNSRCDIGATRRPDKDVHRTRLGAREPHVERLALPKSVDSGNLSPMDAGLKETIVMAVRWSLTCLVGIYILMMAGLAVFQRRLQYFPDRHLIDPAQAGMSGVQDLRLTTGGGETLVAW